MSKITLGRLVQQARQRKGLSQHALAKEAGISVPYVQRLEHGEYDSFPAPYLQGIANALQVDVQVLTGERDKLAQGSEAADSGAASQGGKSEDAGESSTTPPQVEGGPVDVVPPGAPLMSLVPPVDLEKLMQDVALLPDEDQLKVTAFVHDLLEGQKRN